MTYKNLDKKDLVRIKDELLEGLDRDLKKFIDYCIENDIDINGIHFTITPNINYKTSGGIYEH